MAGRRKVDPYSFAEVSEEQCMQVDAPCLSTCPHPARHPFAAGVPMLGRWLAGRVRWET